MSNESKYPFELKNSFFVSLSFRRAPQVPQPIELPIATEVNIAEPGFPVLQIAVKVTSPADSPISFDVHLVGIFEYQGEQKEYDHDLNIDYAFERGIYLLWSNISQMVKAITAQMAISPIQVRTPITFGSRQNVQEVG
jgi:hypothetical protein